MARSVLCYCGRFGNRGLACAQFEVRNRDSEYGTEGEIDTSLCNLDEHVQCEVVEDLLVLPSNESQENEFEREDPFSARCKSKCTALSENLVSCSKSGLEFPEDSSLDKNNQQEKTLDDVSCRTYTDTSSESVSECPLAKIENVPCNVPVLEVVEETHTSQGTSEVCEIDSHSNVSAVQIPHVCNKNVVQSCDTVRDSCDISGQTGIPSNINALKGSFVTLHLNTANYVEGKRNPIAEFAVEVNGMTVIIKEFVGPCQEDRNNPFTSENMNVDINENISKHSNSQIENIGHRANETETVGDYEQLNENEDQENATGETLRKGKECLITCVSCSSSHESYEDMIFHFQKNHINTKCVFKCPFPKCPSTISYKTAASHLRGHVQKGVYTCQHCSFSTWHGGGFSRHVAAHKSGESH